MYEYGVLRIVLRTYVGVLCACVLCVRKTRFVRTMCDQRPDGQEGGMCSTCFSSRGEAAIKMR